MDEREITKYAAKITAGLMVEEELIEIIGDDSIVARIMVVAATSMAVSDLIDNTVDVSFDVIDEVYDVIDDFNPFSDW